MKRLILTLVFAVAGCSTGAPTNPQVDATVGVDTTQPPRPVGCAPDECDINEVCYPAGVEDPTNYCRICTPGLARNNWSVNNGAACEDGNECTQGDSCQGTSCIAGIPKVCTDGNVCTDDGCLPDVGCSFTPNGLPCDDGSACTQGDACKDGVCYGHQQGCDDGNPCTIDSCQAETGCVHTGNSSASCRPIFTKIEPARGATVLGQPGQMQVMVKGTVASGAGAITSLKLNGQEVAVGAQGAFSKVVSAHVGTNILVFEATDAMNETVKRVQSFQWSTQYLKPDDQDTMSGAVTEAFGVWLGKATIDDGSRDYNDPKNLGTLAELVLQTIDIGSMIPSPAGNADAGALGNYDVFLTNVTHDPPQVSLTPMSGMLHVTGAIYNLKANFEAKKTCGVFDGCVGPGTITGTVTATQVDLSVDITLDVVDHKLVAQVKNVSVNFDEDDVSIDVDGFFGFIVEWILGFFKDDLAATLKEELKTVASDELGPLIASALEAFSFNTTFELPTVSGDKTVDVGLASDFEDVAVVPQGVRLIMRAAGYGAPVSPYVTPAHLGVPSRVGCGGGLQSLIMSQSAAVEAATADDVLNSMLYSAWRGGILEFVVPDEMLGEVDLSQYGVSKLKLTVSGMQAPTISDCQAGGELVLQVGDLRVNADVTLLALPIPLEIYASVELKVSLDVQGSVCQSSSNLQGCAASKACEEAVCKEHPSCCTQQWDQQCAYCAKGVGCANAIAACGPRLEFIFGDFRQLETEIRVTDEELWPAEEAIRSVIEEMLIPELPNILSANGPLSFPIPEMDIGGLMPGIPEGTKLSLDPLGVTRNNGTTVVQGTID